MQSRSIDPGLLNGEGGGDGGQGDGWQGDGGQGDGGDGDPCDVMSLQAENICDGLHLSFSPE